MCRQLLLLPTLLLFCAARQVRADKDEQSLLAQLAEHQERMHYHEERSEKIVATLRGSSGGQTSVDGESPTEGTAAAMLLRRLVAPRGPLGAPLQDRSAKDTSAKERQSHLAVREVAAHRAYGTEIEELNDGRDPSASELLDEAEDWRSSTELGDGAAQSNTSGAFVSAIGSYTTKAFQGLNNSFVEVKDAEAKVFTEQVVKTLQSHAYPSFVGDTQYFTGKSKPGQNDGGPFPGTSASGTSGPGSLSFVTSIAPLTIQNDVLWEMMYLADNPTSEATAGPESKSDEKKSTPSTNSTANSTKNGSNSTNQTKPTTSTVLLGDAVHPSGFGKVRSVDPNTGEIKTIAEFDRFDRTASKTRSVLAVAAHSFIHNGTRKSFVYAGLENTGVVQMDLKDKSMKQLTVPVTKGQRETVFEDGYRDLCIAAPLTRDHRVGSPLLFLHYRKQFYSYDASNCTGKPADQCAFVPLTQFDHHEGFKKTMACTAYVYKAPDGEPKYSMFVTQRGGTKIVQLDFTGALKVKDATVEQRVIAQTTGESVDGPEPSFLKFQSVSIYSPKWSAAAEPFLLVSGGGELRIFNHAKKHARTLARSEDGAVAVVGDFAYSGRHRLFKSDLHFRIKCGVVNQHVLPHLVKWKIPSAAIFVKEVKSIQLHTFDANSVWVFKAYKKTANTISGVFEKTAFCSRQQEVGKTYFYEHCCLLKFSRALPNVRWGGQVDETELF